MNDSCNESFMNDSFNVLFMNDSITIICNAQVQIAVHIFGMRVLTNQMKVLKIIFTCVDSVPFPVMRVGYRFYSLYRPPKKKDSLCYE